MGFHPNSTFLAELGKGKFPLVQVELDKEFFPLSKQPYPLGLLYKPHPLLFWRHTIDLRFLLGGSQGLDLISLPLSHVLGLSPPYAYQ